MSTVFPIDEFIADEWYPGFAPGSSQAPWIVEPFRTFSKADEERFWFLDFHWTRGLTPMGLLWNEDCYSWGTQLAAESLPLPSGRGITQRIAGTHTYAAPVPVDSNREALARTKRMERNLPKFLDNFDQIWSRRVAEIEYSWKYFRNADLRSMSRETLATYLLEARAYHKRAFEIHFEIMYPLLANYVGFRGLCAELDIPPQEIAKFLQGYDTKIMETDRRLWELAGDARSAGLADVFASTEPGELVQVLTSMGGAANRWLSSFSAFLDKYGFRTEGPCDIAMPSWREEPAPALGMIKDFLQHEVPHDFGRAHAAAVEERDVAVDQARSSLTKEEQRAFDAALASCQAANFAWWQDEHNYYIDLRVSLPIRWACLEISERVGAQRPDDTLFLFWPEIMTVVTGERDYAAKLQAVVEQRRDYFEYWRRRRACMPKVLGTVPEVVDDPVLIEIFGLNRRFLDSVKSSSVHGPVRNLTGVPVARGVARGIARVVKSPDDIYRIQPGDILVCESTSPNWTPIFARIAGCICDSGGTLSHAAIVGREYGVPTVTAVGVATAVIRDGDQVDVNGTTGTVSVFDGSLLRNGA